MAWEPPVEKATETQADTNRRAICPILHSFYELIETEQGVRIHPSAPSPFAPTWFGFRTMLKEEPFCRPVAEGLDMSACRSLTAALVVSIKEKPTAASVQAPSSKSDHRAMSTLRHGRPSTLPCRRR